MAFLLFVLHIKKKLVYWVHLWIVLLKTFNNFMLAKLCLLLLYFCANKSFLPPFQIDHHTPLATNTSAIPAAWIAFSLKNRSKLPQPSNEASWLMCGRFLWRHENDQQQVTAHISSIQQCRWRCTCDSVGMYGSENPLLIERKSFTLLMSERRK